MMVSVRLSSDLYKHLENESKRSGMPVSVVVRRALEAYLTGDQLARIERKLDGLIARGLPSAAGAPEVAVQTGTPPVREVASALLSAFGGDDDDA